MPKKSLGTYKSKERSRLFTELDGKCPIINSNFISHYNKTGKKVFTDKAKLKKAKEFLRSGKVRVIIPAYEEHQFGAIYKVLDYFNNIINRENILIIDADSKDKTGLHVKKLGYEIIEQHDIEKCLMQTRIAADFGVDFPLRRGKGKTLFLAAIYQKIAYLAQNKTVEFNLFSDSDIYNPHRFNHAKYLAWVASHYAEAALLEVKVAQHNRNNQCVMNTMAMLQSTNPIMHNYFRVIREIIWPLTGEIMRSIKLVNCAPNTLGYSTEMSVNIACVDFMKRWNMQSAQVEIPIRCVDSKNDALKEAAMMTGISTTLYAMNEVLFKKGIPLIDMQTKDYRALNEYLKLLENYSNDGFLVSGINSRNRPNEIFRIRLDRILPSVDYFIEHGYVDVEKIIALKKKH